MYLLYPFPLLTKSPAIYSIFLQNKKSVNPRWTDTLFLNKNIHISSGTLYLSLCPIMVNAIYDVV